jgi:superfamily II DNA or RNA helicase
MPGRSCFRSWDADSSQLEVMEQVRQGRTIVVQGPPGTGKSQTIVNLIAQALREGKKVLFVSEKRAALEVVYERLEKQVWPACVSTSTVAGPAERLSSKTSWLAWTF